MILFFRHMKHLFTVICISLAISAFGQYPSNYDDNKFKQLEELLPTPNVYRAGSGEPGPNYWQQKADYDIEVELDDENQRIIGKESITYYNNSPLPLKYLWVQLDQNVRAKDSDKYKTNTLPIDDKTSFDRLDELINVQNFDGGYKINYVKDRSGNKLSNTIVKTMMRIDLPRPLRPGQNTSFSIAWEYNINDATKEGRGGYEFFPEDSNYLYEIAQWFPRMAVYDDYHGWQHKQFLGRGEFALVFGDYKVAITVPADHVVAATGELQNASSVLKPEWRERLNKARGAKKPVLIITEEEAAENEKSRAKGKKTWVFEAENVRDFAWASSRKFVWDAKTITIGGKEIWAMSYYPKEGNPLWGQYSTEVVAHTLKVYSKYTIPYPYPVAISVHGPVWGMEYPMICFNGGRPEPDGTYSDIVKYAMIGVITHEVGHNFFPMIVNSDERLWTWMDEGLNTFVQYLAETEWQRDFPHRRGPATQIVDYMRGDPERMVPIMSNSESILQFGNNSYGKPAAALNILRETVLGRELFDYAFKEYARRWAFKHPKPADFFRTMEDASGVDLDWFWRGWFYTTDHVDISIDNVDYLRVDTRDPEKEKPLAREDYEKRFQQKSAMVNKKAIEKTLMEERPDLKDFYNEYDPYEVTEKDKLAYQRYIMSLDSAERELLQSDKHIYIVDFSNRGGLVMPIILELTYEDGSKELRKYPAEIWKLNNKEIRKEIVLDKPIVSMELDPYLETADTDLSNNHFPRKLQPSRFQLYKGRSWSDLPNPMRESQRSNSNNNKGTE